MEIVNVVAVGSLGREYDLHALSKDLTASAVEYNPENFAGVQIRYRLEGPLLMLYTSGSFTIVGAQSRGEIDEIFSALIDDLDRLEIGTGDDVEPPSIRNIVCTKNLSRQLHLPNLCVALGVENTEYEPEQSPFVYYRPEGFDCLISIPANGRVVVTGVREVDEAERALKHLQEELKAKLPE